MTTVHTVLVLAFVGVTTLLLAMTVAHRLRIRGVRMVWRAGKLGGLPVWPTVFMGIVTVFLVFAQNTAPVLGPSLFLGYILGGALWFMSVVLSSSVIITEYGIIPEAGRSGEATGWGQVSDWFEVDEGRRIHFVFMYDDFLGDRCRLQVPVPLLYADRFRRIVRSKLEARTEAPAPLPVGHRAMENRN